MMHLPSQLAHVDPIVASFCGGAVGVLSAFMVVEANNAKAQEKRRCQYCEVTPLYPVRAAVCVTVSTIMTPVFMDAHQHLLGVQCFWVLLVLPAAILSTCQRLCRIAQAWLCKSVMSCLEMQGVCRYWNISASRTTEVLCTCL